MPEQLEPAKHDDPEGSTKGWSSKDVDPAKLDESAETSTVTIADGKQTVDDVEKL